MEPFVAEYIGWLERENKWLFSKLIEYSTSMKNKLKVSFLFNAYQPRCNRAFKAEKQPFPDNENPFFHNLYEKIKSLGIERKQKDSLVAIAAADCYVPLIIIGEQFPNAISIAFPQVTLDMIRNRYPRFMEKLSCLYADGFVDVGISSYHHSFAPLLDEKLLVQEYSSSLSAFLSYAKIKRKNISLHIPECAISPSLMGAIAKVQKENFVEFVTILDSDYHNKGGFYDIGRLNRINYFANGNSATVNILFSNNYFSRKLFSFPPNSDPKDVGFWYFTRLFESVAKTQPYPYWEKMKSGETVRFAVHTDAETIGFYMQERVYSLYLMLHLMKNFDIGFSYVSNFDESEIVLREGIEPLLYKTWDMETGGAPNRWLKRDFDSSTQFFFTAKELIPPLLDELTNKENQMDRIERKRLWIAKMRWANALTSCPHWWSEPNSVAGKQFARDILEAGKQIRLLERHFPPLRKEILNATKRFEEHPFVKRALV
ncbi:MAG: hypothetical protein N3G74_00390 [Candidatus Micrarchaeota archaeon]|nr:hypothetical protein [Candidatus Micrarchaeota archaeon]